MKAVIRARYGPPETLEFGDVEAPVPSDDEVLVRVRATSLNKSDLFQLNPPLMMRLLMGDGRRRPRRKLFGTDLAGVVESVGRNVKQFRPGDWVFGIGYGAFAEFACAHQGNVAKLYTSAFEDSASLPVAATTALQALRWADVKPGQKVLIDGTSGGVGTFMVQVAKVFGAEVTAVCSTRNADSAVSLGADHVVDYTKEDFTKTAAEYDCIVEVNGYRSVFNYGRKLGPRGTYVMAGSSRPVNQMLQSVVLGPLVSRKDGKRMGFMGIAKVNRRDLETLDELLREGKLRPLIERRYRLSETAEAFRYFAEGHVRGKLVIAC